jgi:glutamate 5-kinase
MTQDKYPNSKVLVVAVGPSFLFRESKSGKYTFRGDQVDGLVHDVSTLNKSGKEVALVTGGALQMGLANLGLSEPDVHSDYKKAAIACGGQEMLMGEYAERLIDLDTRSAQVILSYQDTDGFSNYLGRDMPDELMSLKVRRRNIRRILDSCFESNMIPILGENHATVTEDNDFGGYIFLASSVADLVEADVLYTFLSKMKSQKNRDALTEFGDAVTKDGISFEVIDTRYTKSPGGVYVPKMARYLV